MNGVRCRMLAPDHLVIEVIAAPDHDTSLELYTADQRKDLLCEVLGWTIEIAVS